MKCAIHPESDIAGACVYCGKLFCSDCLVEVNGKMYCKGDISKVVNEAKSSPQQFQQPIINISNNNNNINKNANYNSGVGYFSDKSKGSAVLLCLLGLIGFCGIHRMYVGKIGTGLLWFFTLGLFGIGQLIDFIIILTGGFRDSLGRPLR